MQPKQVILASGSPRRRELLGLICQDFAVLPSGADETLRDDVPLGEEIMRLAADKARDVLGKTSGARAVIGSDTMVVLGGVPMGKPCDAADARRMLRALSGRTHEVLTGVAVVTDDGTVDTRLSATSVTFYELTDDEIARYVATGEPLDKAGAYGIQGRGALLVQSIQGDYYSVMGLPVALLARMLRAADVI